MRILPRIRIPGFLSWRKNLRRRLRRVSIANLALTLEALIYVSLLVFIFTGRRAAFLNELEPHFDAYAALLLLAGLSVFHKFARRRLVSRIEEYFFPKPYEERQIFSGLGLEARTADSIDQLYSAIVQRIAESMQSDNVSLFVRNDSSGDYACVASSSIPIASGTSLKNELPRTGLRSKFAYDAFIVKRLDRLSTPLVIESRDFEIWTRALGTAPAHLRNARALELENLRLFKSHLLVQIRTKNQMVGILSLGLRRGHFGYSSSDRETLMSVAAQLALIVENSRLTERMVIQERLNRELMLAAEVQKRLLPSRAPDHLSFQLAGFCEPARGVGGAYNDFIAVDKDRVGIAIADVAGKGMPAALLMSTVQATLRSLTTIINGLSPSVEPSLAQLVGNSTA
jgi:phosphoserine phosphatase RsbU/P